MATKTDFGRHARDELRYQQMLNRCELHNAQAETITRMATLQETERYMKLLEEDKRERELAAIEKARFYECEARRNAKY